MQGSAAETAKGKAQRHGSGDRLCFSIPSRLSAVERVCRQVRRLLERRRLQHLLFDVELVARECLNNAITHGNGGRPHCRVDFELLLGRRRISLRIADEGPGFDWRCARRQGWPGETACSGRGLLLVRTCAQGMRFNRKGNQITVWIATAREGR